MFHQASIKIFLLNSQKGEQMRQSNHFPPLQLPKVGSLLSHVDAYKQDLRIGHVPSNGLQDRCLKDALD